MTTIALNLKDPAVDVAALRRLASYAAGHEDATHVGFIADWMEDAIPKPAIVLDVDALGLVLSDDLPNRLRNAASALGGHEGAFPTARKILAAVADALDSLTPPEPTYFIASDGDDEPTLWRDDADHPGRPWAMTRRCENPDLWDLTIAGKFEVRDS